MDQKENVTRRSFIDKLVLASGIGALGVIGYPITKFVIPPEQAEPDNLSKTVGDIGEIGKGEYRIFEFNRKPAIVIRTGSDAQSPNSYHALSAVCTHLQCTVQYEKASGQIYCACHNGRFNLAGKVLSGPPPAPLKTFTVDVRNNKLIISVESA
ncbi:MAG TPA: ubiquinol-cytochrome c reductase iron-sulfur subunit [Bacteroidetes bacterium]|nr:cytochrome b6-f complex iron-sulfur subunit [bacterium BMS3Bbin04]HDO66335.1 ubiquinol-cytochrome c reductase iron-sulfur subunit [Bacteroidota bacterium]HEX05460.1 ubiquinol-cytochrome c reductase iron-sulfur subunit [Bacteroidota bacterium]